MKLSRCSDNNKKNQISTNGTTYLLLSLRLDIYVRKRIVV